MERSKILVTSGSIPVLLRFYYDQMGGYPVSLSSVEAIQQNCEAFSWSFFGKCQKKTFFRCFLAKNVSFICSKATLVARTAHCVQTNHCNIVVLDAAVLRWGVRPFSRRAFMPTVINSDFKSDWITTFGIEFQMRIGTSVKSSNLDASSLFDCLN